MHLDPAFLALVQGVLAQHDSTTFPKCAYHAVDGSNQCLRYVPKSLVSQLISKSGLSAQEVTGLLSNSDLIPNKYEGGFKVWESTRDLLELVDQQQACLLGKRVLDLGCGSGLVGISCLRFGSVVCFQDFNQEVLKWFTTPNILLNEKTLGDESVTLMPGDWDSIQFQGKFDLIFSAETVYSTDNYSKLVDVIKRGLAPGGCAFIAGKSHYFGVGGGTRSFQDFLESDSRLMASMHKVIEAGVQREVLRVTHRAADPLLEQNS